MAHWVYHRYFAVTVAVFTLALLVTTLGLTVKKAVHVGLTTSAQGYLTEVDEIVRETQHTLDLLNQKPQQNCDAADLAVMRSILLGTRYIRDITYYQQTFASCSASADYLKIDKSFIQDMEADSIKSTLIPKIRDIAHLLQFSIVAEGIENASQANLLRNLGIDLGQGWHFAKAMPINEFSDWLTQLATDQPRKAG